MPTLATNKKVLHDYKVIEEFELKIKPKTLENADTVSMKINNYKEEDWKNATTLKKAMEIKKRFPSKIFIHRIDGPLRTYRPKEAFFDKLIFKANSFCELSIPSVLSLARTWSALNPFLISKTFFSGLSETDEFNRLLY